MNKLKTLLFAVSVLAVTVEQAQAMEERTEEISKKICITNKTGLTVMYGNALYGVEGEKLNLFKPILPDTKIIEEVVYENLHKFQKFPKTLLFMYSGDLRGPSIKIDHNGSYTLSDPCVEKIGDCYKTGYIDIKPVIEVEDFYNFDKEVDSERNQQLISTLFKGASRIAAGNSLQDDILKKISDQAVENTLHIYKLHKEPEEPTYIQNEIGRKWKGVYSDYLHDKLPEEDSRDLRHVRLYKSYQQTLMEEINTREIAERKNLFLESKWYQDNIIFKAQEKVIKESLQKCEIPYHLIKILKDKAQVLSNIYEKKAGQLNSTTVRSHLEEKMEDLKDHLCIFNRMDVQRIIDYSAL